MAKKGKPKKSVTTIEEVKAAQKKWARAILDGKPKDVTDLYAKNSDNWSQDTGSGAVRCGLAFNPTLDDNFLTTQDETFRYFAGTDEKPGFAKKHWTAVIFDPDGHSKVTRFITLTRDGAVAVGRYVFERETVVLDVIGQEVLVMARLAVDYTFVYKKFGGDLKIIAHHSSLPISQK